MCYGRLFGACIGETSRLCHHGQFAFRQFGHHPLVVAAIPVSIAVDIQHRTEEIVCAVG